MKQAKLNSICALLVSAVVLAGCGGGDDDEAGSPTTFVTVPATSGFTAPAGTPAGICVAGGVTKVFVYGGAAPYHIDNTVPDYLTVDTTEVGNTGGSFTVTVTGAGCLTTGTIVVKDKLNHIVTFTVDNKPAS